MSITLLTAVPGGGKTSYAVWHVIREADQKKRCIYVNAIPELKIPTIKVKRDQIRTWHEREPVDPNDDEGKFRLLNFKEGSLIVADEIQYLWPASGSREPPEDIKYLTQHRKHGLDFLLITQSPHLVHSHVLKVVERHIHITNTWSGRKIYEWPEYCANPVAKTNKDNAVKKQYKLPKESFDLYYSASIHTKPKKSIPPMLYFSLIALLAIPVMIYAASDRVLSKLDEEEPENVQQETETLNELDAQESGLQTHPDNNQINRTTDPAPQNPPETITRVLPTLVSAKYDWDNITACMDSKKFGCVCYGKSSERLMIPLETCQTAARYGWTQQKNKTRTTGS